MLQVALSYFSLRDANGVNLLEKTLLAILLIFLLTLSAATDTVNTGSGKLTPIDSGDTTAFDVYGRNVNLSLTVNAPESKGDFLTIAFTMNLSDSNEYAISRSEASVLDYYLVYGCVLDFGRERTINTLWKDWGNSNNQTFLAEAEAIFPHIYDAVLSKTADAYYGSIVLPKLPDGTHNVTVWVRAEQDFLSTWANIWATFSKTITFTLDTLSPSILVLSPKNTLYNTTSIPLTLTTNEPFSTLAYSLDGQENKTITGNTTLTNLPNGNHNVTVYAWDEAGNTGASENLEFSVNAPELTQVAVIVIFVAVSAVATGLGLLIFKKRRQSNIKAETRLR